MDISTGAIVVAIGVIIFFFRDMIFSLFASSARKAADKAEEKDKTLAQQQDDINDAANAAKNEADRLGNEAQNSSVDEDWHKRK